MCAQKWHSLYAQVDWVYGIVAKFCLLVEIKITDRDEQLYMAIIMHTGLPFHLLPMSYVNTAQLTAISFSFYRWMRKILLSIIDCIVAKINDTAQREIYHK